MEEMEAISQCLIPPPVRRPTSLLGKRDRPPLPLQLEPAYRHHCWASGTVHHSHCNWSPQTDIIAGQTGPSTTPTATGAAYRHHCWTSGAVHHSHCNWSPQTDIIAGQAGPSTTPTATGARIPTSLLDKRDRPALPLQLEPGDRHHCWTSGTVHHSHCNWSPQTDIIAGQAGPSTTPTATGARRPTSLLDKRDRPPLPLQLEPGDRHHCWTNGTVHHSHCNWSPQTDIIAGQTGPSTTPTATGARRPTSLLDKRDRPPLTLQLEPADRHHCWTNGTVHHSHCNWSPQTDIIAGQAGPSTTPTATGARRPTSLLDKRDRPPLPLQLEPADRHHCWTNGTVHHSHCNWSPETDIIAGQTGPSTTPTATGARRPTSLLDKRDRPPLPLQLEPGDRHHCWTSGTVHHSHCNWSPETDTIAGQTGPSTTPTATGARRPTLTAARFHGMLTMVACWRECTTI